ncbi:MAG: haloacid dehalogenase type II [Roseinatronobacter sp.]
MTGPCVFDAYGTLFDVDAAARLVAARAPGAAWVDQWPKLSSDWRRKQLEYSWLRTLAAAHKDFWRVTQDALDWALEANGLQDPVLRSDLLAIYRELPTYPDVPEALEALRAAGTELAILSNGSREMLADAVTSAGMSNMFAAVLSVDDVGVFKPAPAVYDMVGAHFGCSASDVLFVSANGWDICSGAAYGFRTIWLNRAGVPMDRLHAVPDAQAQSLQDVLSLIERL